MRIRNFLELKEWADSDSSVWREILSRWGQSDYDDLTKRQEHMDALKLEWDAKDYARNRATEYPSIGDQLDLLWHAIDTGDWTAAKVKTTDFYTKLKKVKDDNPKPS